MIFIAISFCSLQEPTTGLDSSLAFEMMKTLQGFASESDKAIVTIDTSTRESYISYVWKDTSSGGWPG